MIYRVGEDLVSRPRPLPVVLAALARKNPNDPVIARQYLALNAAQRREYFDALEVIVMEDGG